MNEEQEKVLAAVTARPGSTAVEIGQSLTPRLNRSRTLAALNELEEAGKVERRSGQRRVNWHPLPVAVDG